MTRALLPGNAAIVLFGVMSGRKTLTSCAADSYLRVMTCVTRRSPPAPSGPTATRAALLLRVRLGHDLHDAFAFDHRVALHPQRRQEGGIDKAPRHRARGDDVDRPLDPGIDQKIAPGDVRDRLDDGFDIRVDEIEGDGVVGRHCQGREPGAERESQCGQHAPAHANWTRCGVAVHRSTQFRGQTRQGEPT
jgi:hypothetical protein